MLQPRTIHRTRTRKSEAKRLRHRLVVQGLVVTRRAMSPPLLQHNAAPATSRAPRRAASGSETAVMSERANRAHATSLYATLGGAERGSHDTARPDRLRRGVARA